ncbi:hypothetical protein BDK51DRAFT_12242, partial [Blyttiomyces helicus]
ITITIKPLKSPTPPFTLTLSRLEPIEDVKSRVAAALNGAVPVGAQRLVFKGKGMLDGKTLLDYEV